MYIQMHWDLVVHVYVCGHLMDCI